MGTGNRSMGTGDRKLGSGMGVWKWETGNGSLGTGDWEWESGNRRLEWESGNRRLEWESGNRRLGMGVWEQELFRHRLSPNPTRLMSLGFYLSISSLCIYFSEAGRREGMNEAMTEVRRQCSHTHNAGHALLLILLCQRLMSEWNRDV